VKRSLLVVALLGCGRIETVARGSTSIFRATAPAPVESAAVVTPDARLAALFVGHATVLLQIGDRVIATDPVVSARVGTLAKRIVAPGLPAHRWPQVDLVLISHVHFDHLSYASLSALERKIDLLAMPRGGLSYLPDYAFEASEIDAWSSIEHRGLRVTAVPARHGGWRYGVDAAWAKAAAGFVIEGSGVRVYFAGDTGYDASLFRAIRARFPKIDLALLPIAPVEPHDEVGAWHMDPAEAVRAFRDLDAEMMIPIHYDAFINSLDRRGDASRALERALADQEVDRARVASLAIGERRVFRSR
jgi:L-ascorbate metabolism protein UlaG (beta-lactamase superfamily)